MEVEAEPDALEEALDVVVRVAEGRGVGGGDQARPLLRTRLSPGQDAAEDGSPETAYSLSGALAAVSGD